MEFSGFRVVGRPATSSFETYIPEVEPPPNHASCSRGGGGLSGTSVPTAPGPLRITFCDLSFELQDSGDETRRFLFRVFSGISGSFRNYLFQMSEGLEECGRKKVRNGANWDPMEL